MDTFWGELLEQMLLMFLPVIAAFVVGLLYALLRKTWAEFKEAQPDIAWAVERAASMAVKAAEQAGAAGYIEDKKSYAMQIADEWLKSKGMDFDLNLLDAAIEAAVYDEINRQKEPAE